MPLASKIEKGHRVVILAGTGGGKSVLSEFIVQALARRTRRILILDTKPRYNPMRGSMFAKPARLPYGRDIDAVEVSDFKSLEKWWKKPESIAIARRPATEVEWPVTLGYLANRLYNIADGREAWVVVDESIDWFSWNGAPSKPGRFVSQISRNGREKGLGSIFLSQRAGILPKQTMMDANTIFLGRLDGEDDIDRLHREFGVPRDTPVPELDLHFTKIVKPYRQNKPEPYIIDFNRK